MLDMEGLLIKTGRGMEKPSQTVQSWVCAAAYIDLASLHTGQDGAVFRNA